MVCLGQIVVKHRRHHLDDDGLPQPRHKAGGEVKIDVDEEQRLLLRWKCQADLEQRGVRCAGQRDIK